MQRSELRQGSEQGLWPPSEGELIDGKYRLGPKIGEGGMATVHAATHLRLDERVAIKMLLPEHAADPRIVERFAREGRAAIKIRSEHVVRILDVGGAQDAPYLVMEYLEGQDLAAVLEERGAIPVQMAVDLVLQACEALAEAHAQGIVHRDLKPANLFLTHRADGTALLKVLDFGISKVEPRRFESASYPTLPMVVMGSPHYMSPEQMHSSADVDPRTDLWAIGAILHELITGAPPFNADTLTELYARILRDPPPPLVSPRDTVPPGLADAVRVCLEKDVDRRYSSVADLAEALAAYGSSSAHASAETIVRVVERTSGLRPRPRAPMLSAREILAADPEPAPRRRSRARGRVAGYLVGWALMAMAGGATARIAAPWLPPPSVAFASFGLTSSPSAPAALTQAPAEDPRPVPSAPPVEDPPAAPASQPIDEPPARQSSPPAAAPVVAAPVVAKAPRAGHPRRASVLAPLSSPMPREVRASSAFEAMTGRPAPEENPYETAPPAVEGATRSDSSPADHL